MEAFIRNTSKDRLKLIDTSVRNLLVTALGLLVWLPSLQGQFYYGLNQDYGKNRVQFDAFDWVYYRFENYDLYFDRSDPELASQVARLTDKNLQRVEDLLDAQLNERLRIMVFRNLTKLKQSNVLQGEEEDFNSVGVTRTAGKRLFVYFNGDYGDLERHLREGITEAVLASMIYGSFTQSVANSALLNLPDWFSEGLLSYIGEDWYPGLDARVVDGFYSGRYKRINALTGEEARHAGHSFWHFIAKTYGRKVIQNIVYLAVVNRDIESGFKYILGKKLKQVIYDWRTFYCEKYPLIEIDDYYEDLDEVLKARKNHRITHMEMSANGRYIAYVEQRFSRYKLRLYDLKEDKRETLLRAGSRIAQNADYSYPVLAWHPNNRVLAFFTEQKGIPYLNFYDLEKDELREKPFYRFEKVLSAEYSRDGKQLLLSAVKDGQSDIYLYTILNTKSIPITQDKYDDLAPAFYDQDRKVVWRSNRSKDTLYYQPEVLFVPTQRSDLWTRPISELRRDDTLPIRQVTNSPTAVETEVQEYSPGFLSFLSNKGGLRSQHFVKIDSSIAYVDTITHYNYQYTEYRNPGRVLPLTDQVYAEQQQKRYDLVIFDKKFRLYQKPYLTAGAPSLDELNADNKGQTAGGVSPANQDMPPPLYYPGVSRKDFEVNIQDYEFGTPAPDNRRKLNPAQPDTNKPLAQLAPAPDQVQLTTGIEARRALRDTLEIPPRRNYFLSFFENKTDVRFDNMFNNNQYQPFTGQVSGGLLNQGFNANMKVGARELMHDYTILGAVSPSFQPLPGNSLMPNAEYLVAIGDYKKRLDRELSYRRRSNVQFLAANNYQRLISNVLELSFTWPFSPVASVRGSIGMRLDEQIPLARDFARLDQDITYRSRALAKLAYVYDNTRKIGTNLRAGLRYKFFTEYYRNLDESPSGLHTAGLDARHYLVLHRNLIWANRLATGTSFGPEKLIHIMGGVDNAFNQQTDQSTPIARDNNYVFQTLITNMRGFFQNVRNGNSFALVNSELRWPILSYLANKPLRNDFLNNLMLIGFADVGTAWNGPSPWSDENAINTRTIPFGGGGEIVLDSQKNPIVFGSGFGVRSRLFGYYLRADWAWGIEDNVILPRVFYFSIGTDF